MAVFKWSLRYMYSVCIITFITHECFWCCYSARVPAAVPSLYDISDQVTVLDNRTLRSTVYGSDQTWFVQFYSSWCGHCVHFAPTWKAFAANITGWQSITRVAAVNCADQQNRKICSSNIDVGFPTLRLFRALQKNGTGDICKGPTCARDVIHLRHALVDHITKHSTEEYTPSYWPRLVPVRITWLPKDFARNMKPGIKFIATVFEDAESYAGRELILDMIDRKEVMVVRVLQQDLNNSPALTKWNVTRFPSLFIFKQSEEPKELLTSETRHSMYHVLQAYLNQSSILLKNKDQSIDYSKEEIKNRRNDLPRVPSVQHLIKSNKEQRETDSRKTHTRSGVFMQDLESTLIYSLKHEVGLQRFIKGRALSALKAYIQVLNKYFPGRLFVMNVLSKLQGLLQSQSEISNDGWFDILKQVQSPLSADQEELVFFLENDVRWVGCQGSTHVYRGYPCGLWILFHTLTVSQAALHSNDPDADSKEVLIAMKGYMTYFFGCRVCSDNFNKESVSLESSVVTLDDSILWLWKIHNKVNQRLAGALSEDPQYPKEQFPPESDCQPCHDSPSQWRTPAILQYLKDLYSAKNIDSYIYVHGLGPKHTMETKDFNHVKANPKVSFRYFTIGINTTDISICLLLYSICSLLLLVICIYINHRRKRKHVKYII